MTGIRDVDPLIRKFIEFNETGTPPPGLFADDVFVDFTLPHWRLQAGDREGLVALRRAGHPGPSTVSGFRADATETGFVIEWTERWTDGGMDWYCREMARAEVEDGTITELSVYCTGDWDRARVDEHRSAVQLARP
ncbi:MAG TPA: hypothetical protein VH063_02680 [Gaiellaceae bacterium]|nr:hypothetical protein [Gaiellaceae bacterium]